MKLIKSIHPKNLFRNSKKPQISKSAPASFNTAASSSASSSGFDSPKPRRSDCFDLIEAFKLIDRDGDGKITKRDLQTVLSRIGPTEDDLNAFLANIGRGGDACITLEDCAAIGCSFAPSCDPDELKETFDFFDADHDGKITAEELLRVFVSIGDDRCTLDECRRMIDSVDVNGDGFVCFADFTGMMVHQQQ